MRPVLFRFRGIEIRSYPFFLFLGLTFGIIAGTQAGIRAGLDPTRLYIALVLLTIPALIGSRLMYVVAHIDFYRRNPSEIWATRSGGAALYGGLLLALILSWPVLRFIGLSLGGFWDAAMITLLVGMIFTRVGCLLNGCCAGRATSSWLGFNLPDEKGIYRRRFPTQMLELLLAALLLLAAAMLWTRRPFDGVIFLGAVAIYSAARLALGTMRENLGTAASISLYNAASIFLMVGSITAIAFKLR
jgi:prolipoprotein diacylglyceryltransferase